MDEICFSMCYTISGNTISYLVIRMVQVMCGRYQFTAEQSAEIRQIIQAVQDKFGTNAAHAVQQGEIKPGCKMPVLIASENGPTPELLVWGFRTPKSLLINARAETALEKPTFAESTKYRHCAIPSTGFFEWNGDKRKYRFTMPGSDSLYMAGIYDVRNGIPCYCVLTTAANNSMREVHDRMPLVLERDQIEPWLYSTKATKQFLSITPPLLNKQLLDAQIGLW